MEVTVDGLLKSVCIDGAKYRQADAVGKALAHISLLPYLALFYQASVVYSRRYFDGSTPGCMNCTFGVDPPCCAERFLGCYS